MSRKPWRASPLVGTAALVITGCTATTLQQRTAPYPGYGQSQVQMQRDSEQCEAWARQNAGTDTTGQGAVGGAVLGSAVGAGVGAIAGSFFGAAGTGAALGASVGGIRGAAEGAGTNAAAWDQRVVTAYRNCMAGRGYVMSGTIAMPPPAPTSSPAITEKESATSRLEQLEKLHSEGLITQAEYATKVSEIQSGALPPAARLERLKALLDGGLITKKEYQQKRKEILDEL